jgi:hypothetical protein
VALLFNDSGSAYPLRSAADTIIQRIVVSIVTTVRIGQKKSIDIAFFQ